MALCTEIGSPVHGEQLNTAKRADAPRACCRALLFLESLSPEDSSQQGCSAGGQGEAQW